MGTVARRSAVLMAGALLAGASPPGVAHAQQASAASDQNKAAAAALFDDGRALLLAGKVPEACRKLEESRRLDPLPGTILNLAACHEREGLTASAMAEFREARALAERDHRDDRVAFADEHLKAIEPRLSALVIAVPPEADVPGLTVLRDGVAIGRAAWGARIPVDPGAHLVEATAPHKQAQRIELRVGPEGDVQTATIAPLEEAPAAAPPIEPAHAPSATAAREQAPSPAPARHSGLSLRRVWALAALGAGAAALGVGGTFGVLAIVRHDGPQATCTTSPCSSESVTLNNLAKTDADVSTAAFAVGAAAAAVGAFLWLGDSVAMTAGAGSVGVRGRF